MELWSAERVYVKGRFEKDWGVAVDHDGVIQAIGPRQHLVANATTVYHYPDHILLPAFINPHHHGFHRLFRGIADVNAPFRDLLHNQIYPLCGTVSEDLFDAVYRIAFAEQALAGVGTVGEFHYLHNGAFKEMGQAHYAERLTRIASDIGLRLTLIYSFYDQGSTQQSGPFIQPLDTSMQEYEELVEKFRNHPLINIIPGIHGLEHASPDAIIAAAKLAEKYDTTWHIQLAERDAEIELANTYYGTTPLRALEKMEVLNERVVIINGNALNDEELDLVQSHGLTLILCPSATLARGDALTDAGRLLSRDIPFAVGSDSIAMNNHYSVPEEIKLIEFSQRSSQNKMDVLGSQMDIDSLWELGTWIPAQLLGVNAAQFLPGSAADFMLVEISQPCAKPFYHFGKNQHFMNQLIFGWATQATVTHLMVQGKLVVNNGLLRMDLTDSYRFLEKTRTAFLDGLNKK